MGGFSIWRARKDSNLRPSESELTDYFGIIIRNLEYPPVIAYNPELISLVICEKIRNLRQSIATSRGHMRQKMRQKWVSDTGTSLQHRLVVHHYERWYNSD